jgi:hypothetical protein
MDGWMDGRKKEKEIKKEKRKRKKGYYNFYLSKNRLTN